MTKPSRPRGLQRLGHRDVFAFRKRCGWCGVQLRRWQRDLCRRCKEHALDPYAGPLSGSRWDAQPDEAWRER